MHPRLSADLAALQDLLDLAVDEAERYLLSLNDRPVAARLPGSFTPHALPQVGLGAAEALTQFRARYAGTCRAPRGPAISAS